MAGLVLKLRPHEQVLVNGVVVENGDRNTRLLIKTPDANVLRLREAMAREEATTPVGRACFIAQSVVTGRSEPEEAKAELTRMISAFAGAMTDRICAEPLAEARSNLHKGNYYGTLRALRRLLPLEDRFLPRAALVKRKKSTA